MTHGASPLRHHANKKTPGEWTGNNTNKTSGGGRRTSIPQHASPKKTATSSDAPTRPYAHYPYGPDNGLFADVETVQSISLSAQRNKVSGAGHHSVDKDGRRGSGTTRPTAINHPAATAPVYVDASGARMNVCRHYLEGTCNRGSACRFYHPGGHHRVVTAPRTPTQRPLTPLADLLAQERSDLALSSSYASPATLPTSTFADAQRATPPNSDSGNTSFILNPTLGDGRVAAPILSPPSRPASYGATAGPTGVLPLTLPKGAYSPNASVDHGDIVVSSPLVAASCGSPGSSVSKLPSGSPQITFARAPLSPPSKQHHNPYTYVM